MEDSSELRDGRLESLWRVVGARVGDRGAVLIHGVGDGCRLVECHEDSWLAFVDAIAAAAAGAARAVGLGGADRAQLADVVRGAAMAALVEALATRLEVELYTPEVEHDDVPF
jgi:hypothetical protein